MRNKFATFHAKYCFILTWLDKSSTSKTKTVLLFITYGHYNGSMAI